MQRRDFIALLDSVSCWPFLAHAQQKAMPVIGLLGAAFPALPTGQENPAETGLLNGLAKSGYVKRKNLVIEYRTAEGHYNRLPALVETRLALGPHAFSSRFSSLRKRQSVPSSMIFCGLDLTMPASCRRSA